MIDQIFLLPGEATYARKPTRISTLLGSCVAVCLYDTKNHFGGMNHYMLPYQSDGQMAPGKYGDYSIESLFQVAQRAGSRIGDLVASIYGGGRVVGHLGAVEDIAGASIGDRNIQIARDILAQKGVRIIQQAVGGTRGRKIHMDSSTNIIEMREIIASEATAAAAAKRKEFQKRKIGVLIVDDSATVRRILRMGIESSEDMEVIGEAENPYEAREKILETCPDVLCLDIIMPRLDGHSFLKKIMQYKPIPTVIVSTIAKQGSEVRKRVMESGAVDVVDKEELEIYKGLDVIQRVLLPKLRRAASTRVSIRAPKE